MAYVLDEDEEAQQQDPQQKGAEKVLSGQSATVDAGAGAQAQTSTPGKGSSGTGWTNLQNYVTANEGNDATMGAQVQGKVGEQAKTVNDTTTKYGSDAQKSITANTVKDDGTTAKVWGEIEKNASNTPAPAWIQNPYSMGGAPAPTQAAPKAAPTFNFKDLPTGALAKQVNAEYKGPANAAAAEGFSGAKKATEDFSALTGKADDFTGRGELLDSVYARPSYNRGERNLDSFILGAGDAGKASMQAVKDQGAAATSGWDTLVKSLDAQAATGKRTTENTSASARQAIDTALGQYHGYFDDLQAKSSTQIAAENAKLDAALPKIMAQGPQGRAEGFQALGIDPKQGEWLLRKAVSEGVDPRTYFQQAQQQGLGDLVGGDVGDNYNALLGAAGLDSGLSGSRTGGRATAGLSPEVAEALRQAVEAGDITPPTSFGDASASAGTEFDPWAALRTSIGGSINTSPSSDPFATMRASLGSGGGISNPDPRDDDVAKLLSQLDPSTWR